MADIKTRRTVKDIKVFDRAASAGKHMKNAVVRSKDAVDAVDRAAVKTQDSGSESPSEYATGRVTANAKSAAKRTVQGLRKNPYRMASGNIIKTKKNVQDVKRHMRAIRQAIKNPPAGIQNPAVHMQKRAMVKGAQTASRKTIIRTRQAASNPVNIAGQSKTVIRQKTQGGGKAVKATSKTVKGTAAGTRRTARTAARTTKVTARTAQYTVHAAQRATISAAKSARAAKTAAAASRAAARAAVRTARISVRVTIAAVKAIIAATKALVTAIAAGGWIAVIIILIICMIGLLLGSPFGVFFSGEDSGSGYTMPMVIQEINKEYTDKIKDIRDKNAHDEVQMSGKRAAWKEILAIYAVKINTDKDSAQDVATLDEKKKELLRSIFWDMNSITYKVETEEVTAVIVEDDGNGDFTSTEQTVTKAILYITVSHKTAAEMANEYGFTGGQKAQLAELLSEQYSDLWSAILYGVPNGSDDIVAVAISQIGNVGGEPYWSWYGFENRVSWCATFVSWCADQCGYIGAGVIPKFAACQAQGIPWFKKRGLWQEPGYVPAPGDLIFFDWGQDGHSDHVGIVEYVKGDVVHTVEGNTSNSVARRSYSLNSSSICGYGTPMY